jgi:two-component system sensor histidine kinase QseC
MISLRVKLLTSILLVTLAAWGFAAFRSYRDTRKEVDRLFDAHLVESAAALLKQATHEWRERDLRGNNRLAERDRNQSKTDDEDGDDAENDSKDLEYDIEELRERGELLEKSLFFEFWDHSGQLLLRFGKELKGVEAADGFSYFNNGSTSLRVFSQWNEERSLRVVVAESVEARLTLAKSSVANIIQPLLWLIVPLILLLAAIIEWSLIPIRQLSAQVGSRTANELRAIDEVKVPVELKAIIHSLNSLFERLARAIENERRFTADAAHELRTPLAAIKVQAQVALRESQESARRKALEATVAGVDRAAHLVEQLLTLARLDPEKSRPVNVVPLRQTVGLVLQEIAPLAISKALEIELGDGEELQVAGQRDLLAILVRNLLDNAIRYTPAGGSVHVVTVKHKEDICLVVEDTGPGLNEQQMKMLGQRFSRVDRPSGEGCGLGLSIVMKIAAIHHARVSFANRETGLGLVVTVCFPNSQ